MASSLEGKPQRLVFLVSGPPSESHRRTGKWDGHSPSHVALTLGGRKGPEREVEQAGLHCLGETRLRQAGSLAGEPQVEVWKEHLGRLGRLLYFMRKLRVRWSDSLSCGNHQRIL